MYRLLVLITLTLSWTGVHCQAIDDSSESAVLNFIIKTTWDGKVLAEEDFVNLTLASHKDSVQLRISAPYYNDNEDNCQPGMNRTPLWRCEAVEAFFLNDQDEYLQLQFGPFGELIVMFFVGERNHVRKSIFKVFEARISGSTWSGRADIPIEYFPSEITRFNAASFHGAGDLRKYNTLYSADETIVKPDFHKLRFFQPIDLANFKLFTSKILSPIWKSIREGTLNFTIQTTWNGKHLLVQDQINITLDGVYKSEGVCVHIEAPFYGDHHPDCKPGPNQTALPKCEVVEVYFLNDNEEYLQLMFSPYGEGINIFFSGSRNYIRTGLPLSYKAEINGSRWNGTALIPREYFPPRVRKFNAFAMHGYGDDRTYVALYAAEEKAPEPDFHELSYFQPIDMSLLRAYNYNYSAEWETAIRGEFNFTIKTTWNGTILPTEDQINITLNGIDMLDGVCVRFQAPFYDDSDPYCRPGADQTPLYLCEAVEVYFLNDKNEYLQLMFGPYGRHYVIFMNGYRNYIRRNLQVEYHRNISGSTWMGMALIPREYFPIKVTKFNAASYHGKDDSRLFNALYPADDTVSRPDFHLLRFFQPVDISVLRALTFSYSTLWDEALKGMMNFTIEKAWNGKSLLEEDHINITLSGPNDPEGVRIRVRAPFYNDINSSYCEPGAKAKDYYLYACEVVEVFFLNDENAYLEIQFNPHGSKFVIFFNGERNTIRRGLPLDFTAEILDSFWEGSALIPERYFPKEVTKFNAFSIHGMGKTREFNALYPADENATKPDFHQLRFFKSIDLSPFGVFNYDYPPLWDSALKRQLNFTITTTWNGTTLSTQDQINIILDGTNESGLDIRISAPFYHSPSKEEAVEVFFLNDREEYLKIRFNPSEEYSVKFFKGERNIIKTELPLDLKVSLNENTWNGSAIIPREYFPYRVTKFNAGSIYTIEGLKHFTALYPADETVLEPDFHLLRFFQAIDVSPLGVYNTDKLAFSAQWEQALSEQSTTTTSPDEYN